MAARARGWCGGVVGGSRGHGSQTTDGASALIVMPKRSPSGRASARTKATMPALEAAYSGAAGKGYRAALEAVHTMAPPWRLSAGWPADGAAVAGFCM